MWDDAEMFFIVVNISAGASVGGKVRGTDDQISGRLNPSLSEFNIKI